MDFPDKLNILGVPFKIEVRAIDDENAVGETWGLQRKIYISETLDTRRKWTVLVHEWAHAVMYVNGASSVLPEHVEEMVVQCIEHAFEEFLLQVGPQILSIIDEENRE